MMHERSLSNFEVPSNMELESQYSIWQTNFLSHKQLGFWISPIRDYGVRSQPLHGISYS